jgi:hypothetical protein
MYSITSLFVMLEFWSCEKENALSEKTIKDTRYRRAYAILTYLSVGNWKLSRLSDITIRLTPT